MKRLICACAFSATLFATAAAQDKCGIDLSVSPDIRGIKLGMTYDAARANIPHAITFKLPAKIDEANVIESELYAFDLYDKAGTFSGVEKMALIFADGWLVKIGVEYKAGPDWPNVDAFAAQVSKTLALPDWAWRKPNNADPKIARVMDCEGFRVITVSPGGGARTVIGLIDTAAEKRLAERYAAIEEKKRRTFKP